MMVNFKTNNYLELMGNSMAIKLLLPSQIYAVFNMAFDVESEESQKIYDILVEENKRLVYANTEFEKIAKKAMLDFENELTSAKSSSQKKALESLYAETRKHEEEKAAQILNNLK
jgi:Fe-S cluster assembly iron-binding protein IscA